MNECTRVAWSTNAHFNRYMHKWWYFNTSYNICIHKYVSIWTKFCTLMQFLTLQTLIEKHLFQCSDAHLRIFQILYALMNCTGLCSLVVVCMRVVKCCKRAKMKSQNPNEPNKIDSNKMSINACVSPDPQIHGFLFAWAIYDILMQNITFLFANMSVFV